MLANLRAPLPPVNNRHRALSCSLPHRVLRSSRRWSPPTTGPHPVRGLMTPTPGHTPGRIIAMFKLLLIAVGGAAGSLMRYGLSGWVQDYVPSSVGGGARFPLGTLIVNVTGCLA